jgi:hypothetical protein
MVSAKCQIKSLSRWLIARSLTTSFWNSPFFCGDRPRLVRPTGRLLGNSFLQELTRDANLDPSRAFYDLFPAGAGPRTAAPLFLDHADTGI